MKKTYIKPMNSIESADLVEELMVGSEVKVSDEVYDGTKPIQGRESVPSDNLWDDEW